MAVTWSSSLLCFFRIKMLFIVLANMSMNSVVKHSWMVTNYQYLSRIGRFNLTVRVPVRFSTRVRDRFSSPQSFLAACSSAPPVDRPPLREVRRTMSQ